MQRSRESFSRALGSKETIRLWADILNRVPDSRLVVVARGGKDGVLIAYIHEQFGRHGVRPERLEILGIQPQLDYFASYNDIDLGLEADERKAGNTLRAIPLRRFGMPPEVAAATLFLASAEASYITGQSLVVDGGLMLR